MKVNNEPDFMLALAQRVKRTTQELLVLFEMYVEYSHDANCYEVIDKLTDNLVDVVNEL